MYSFLRYTTNAHAGARRLAWLFVVLFSCAASTQAQRIALKTNALYWAAATPNLGAEFRLNRHLTLSVEGAFNRVKIGSIDTRGEMLSPELRYWFSARPHARHFLGVTGVAANYRLALKNRNYDGDAYGAGLTYGYSFVLGKRWSMETTVGAGALYVRQMKYRDGEEKPARPNDVKWTPAPLKAGVSFVYMLR